MISTDVIAEAGLDAFSRISVVLMWVCGVVSLFISVSLVADKLMGRARKSDAVVEEANLGTGTKHN